MAQTSQQIENQTSRSTIVVDEDHKKDNDKDRELEMMRKLLAAKDAEIAALKQKDVKPNDDKPHADESTACGDDESKLPPKTDVTLSIRGVPEFDSYPYAMASDKFFYMASIKAPYFRESDRAPIDLVAVVDESGSMSGNRIKLVKETVQFIIQNLESKDRFGIIGYSTGSREVLSLTAMDAAGKKKAKEMAKGLRARGGTALCQGLVDGVNMMRKRTFKNDIASVMILTDGEANQGPMSASEINACVRKGKVESVRSYNDFLPAQGYVDNIGVFHPSPRGLQKRQQLAQELQALSAQKQQLIQAVSMLQQRAQQQQGSTVTGDVQLQLSQVRAYLQTVEMQIHQKSMEMQVLQQQLQQGQWGQMGLNQHFLQYSNRQSMHINNMNMQQPQWGQQGQGQQSQQQQGQQSQQQQGQNQYNDPFAWLMQQQGQPQGQSKFGQFGFQQPGQMQRQQGQQQQNKDPFSSLSVSASPFKMSNDMTALQQQLEQMQQQQSLLLKIQGGPSGPARLRQPPSNDMIADEDDTKQQPGGVDEESDDLPCTINTFGFGSGHNADLLKALAENGRGMYSYIENTDQISDTFAECLGGLVSIIGQDLKVQIQALNNVEINRCLSKGYSVKVDVPKKKHTVSVKDLQSEESRDFIFELKVPQIEGEKKDDPLIQLSVNYMNVIKGTTETLTNICTVTRISGKQIGERNLALDRQLNRVLAADAMEQADKLAKSGKMADARKVMTNAQDQIKTSSTSDDAFCALMVEDMGRLNNCMQSQSAYMMGGQQQMQCQMQSQQMQRCSNSSAFASQRTYESSNRRAMKSKFKKGGY